MKIPMDDFRVFYDEKEDILYLAKEGQEEKIVELSPTVNAELDSSGNLIGIEVLSRLPFKYQSKNLNV